MLRKIEWFKFILLPFSLTLIFDQLSKVVATRYLKDQVFHNHGFMLGSLADAPPLYTVVAMTATGVFLLYLFFVLNYFLPIKSLTLRVGFAIFMGGVFGNVVDRALYGYVIDFLQIKTSLFSTGIFNIADTFQWVGVLIFFFRLIFEGQILWPANERRGRLLVFPDFQLRYALLITLSGLGFSILSLTFFYTFLKTQALSNASVKLTLITAYVSLSAIFLLSLWIIALKLSHRIAGPVFAFENFLVDLLRGKKSDLQLRKSDEFKQFEVIAEQMKGLIYEKSGLPLPPLESGQEAPSLEAKTYKNELVKLADYRGQKVWLIIYRYATCPICLYHLSSVAKRYDELKQKGLNVIVAFESNSDNFIKKGTGKTADFLKSLPFPLIADPKKEIYRKYRTRRRLFAVLRPSVVATSAKALKSGFVQGTIDGAFGQVPAHFLINEDGTIHQSFYNESIDRHIPWEYVESFVKPQHA